MFHWLVPVLFLFVTADVYSQYNNFIPEDGYTLQLFDSESGLPQNSVKDIIQDSLGYYWLLSEAGIVRFDGHQFVVYDQDNLGLKTNRFIKFIEYESTGNIYAVSDQWDYVNIYTLKVEDSDNYKNEKLEYYSNFVDTTLYSDFRLAYGAPRDIDIGYDDAFFAVRVSDKRFYLCYQHKVEYYDNEKLSFSIEVKDLKYEGVFLLNEKLYYRDEENKFWAVEKSGLRQIFFDHPILSNLSNTDELKVIWSIHQKSVLITLDNRLYKLSSRIKNRFVAQTVMDMEKKGFTAIYSFFESADQNFIFLGSLTKGLLVLRKKQFKVVRVKSNRLFVNSFYSLIPSRPNSLLTPKGQEFTWETVDDVLYRDIADVNFRHYVIQRDAYGYIWTCVNNILYKLDSNYKEVKHWVLNNRVNLISSIYNGRIWISGEVIGIYYIDVYDDNAKPTLYADIDRASVFEKIDESTMYVGSLSGLYKVNLNNASVEEVVGMEGKNIRSLYYSDNRYLWVSTYQSGIFLVDGDVVYDLPNDISNNLSASHCIYEDEKGFFWITTNKGMFKMLKSDLKAYAKGEVDHVFYYYFDKDDGFATNEFNGGCYPCVNKLANGQVVFPSLDGLVNFNPESINEALPNNILKIDAVSIEGESRQIADTLILGSNESQIELQLSTAYLGNTENLQIYYSLVKKGGQPVWTLFNPQTGLVANAVDDGEYRLYIKKMNGYGVDNFFLTKLILIKVPHFYNTIYFYLLLSFGILIFFYTYLQFTTLRIQNRNSNLELEVQKRTKTLQVALTKLNQSQNALKNQIRVQEYLLGAMSHDVVTPLKYLIMMTQKIQNPIYKKDENLMDEIADAMEKSLMQINKLMNDLLEFSKIDIKKEELPILKCNIPVINDEILEGFAIVIQEKAVRVNHEIKTIASVRSNPHLLKIILTNVIDNAIMNSIDSEMNIRYEEDDMRVWIMVEDEGDGVPDEIVEWLNTPSEKLIESQRRSFSSFSGLGLFIVKELAALINVKVWIKKRPKGTQFNIEIPKIKTIKK
ncbi:hypothetical protein GCM10025777_16480 [Membranihabitans marinus]